MMNLRRLVFYTIAALTAVLLQPVIGYSAPSWTVAVYMCGTDLESQYGAGTADLQEMVAAAAGQDVRVVVQTGGALSWHTPGVPTRMVTRYLVDGKGLHELASLPDADMGSGQTLMDFVRFVANEYPAQRNMLVLWNHGGGAMPGVCMDERTRDMIPLTDVRTALAAVHPVNVNQPFFDIVGMDACLMGAVETAASLRGLASYLVASEEWEPGGGWMYTTWLKTISANPAIPSDQLGRVIVDAYMADCKRINQDAMATQAVIDCSQADTALAALDDFAQTVAANPAVAYRAAAAAENYGGNTPAQGYANMVDVVDFAQKLAPNAQVTMNLVNTVDNMVVAHAGGSMRSRGHGLSVYFPLDGDPRTLNAYAQRAGAAAPPTLLNAYMSFAAMPTRGVQRTVLDGVGVDVVNDHASVTVDVDALAQTRAVSMAVVYPDTEAGVMLHLGSCAQVDVDYRRGVVVEQLHGTWPALDGHPLFTELMDVDANHAVLAMPVMVNEQRKVLLLREDRQTGELSIIGLRTPRHADGVVDRGLTQLKPYDRVTLLHRAALLDGENDFTEVQLVKFTIGKKGPKVTSVPLDDGVYAVCFEFTDMNGAVHRSSLAKYVVTNGQTEMYKLTSRR